MTTLDKSLRCLRHPVTLFSLALLLLNDHVLKAAAPGWLTGKLSDVAGLLFFPFVLAALLGFVFDRLHTPPRKVGAAAFGLTALWFALIKLSPWGNALTERLVTTLSGLPSAIALDLTDLLALPVLWPAWKLWDREEPGARHPTRWDWALLGLASLASLATSCVSQPIIDRVTSQDGIVYVRAVPNDGPGWLREGTLARSENAGLAWTTVESAPPELDHEVTLPLVACDPADPSLCFRITGEEQVEESTDGGQTWQIAWQFPADRELYRARTKRRSFSPCAGYGFSPTPRDLTVMRQADGVHIIVAMGSEGVLVRDAHGRWARRAVLGAIPTDWSGNILIVWPEMLALLPISLLGVLLLLSTSGWIISRHVNPGQSPLRSAWLTISATVATVVIQVVWLGLQVASIQQVLADPSTAAPLMLALVAVAPVVLLILPALGVIVTMRQVANIAPRREMVRTAIRWSLLSGMIIVLLGGMSLILWAWGLIPAYRDAMRLGALLVLAYLPLSIWRVRRLALRAATPPETGSV